MSFKHNSNVLTQYIGSNIKRVRSTMGMTRKEIGELFDISGAQIAKYENGVDRISASHLAYLAEVFKIPVTTFYDSDDAAPQLTHTEPMQPDIMNEVRELSKAYQNIQDPILREKILQMVKDFAR